MSPLILEPAFTLELAPPFDLPVALAAPVDAIWAEEKRRLGARLTNGRIYSLVDCQPHRLCIQPAEYRHALARRRAPSLGLAIRPLAVTGILTCPDGLVLGRRGALVASDAGLWEPAPAGGLSCPDPLAQVLEELREEVGLDPACVAPPEACGLVEDIASGVIDIVFRLRTTASAADIRQAYRDHATAEYAELAFIPPAELPAFLATQREHLLPALLPMLRQAGLPTV